MIQFGSPFRRIFPRSTPSWYFSQLRRFGQLSQVVTGSFTLELPTSAPATKDAEEAVAASEAYEHL